MRKLDGRSGLARRVAGIILVLAVASALVPAPALAGEASAAFEESVVLGEERDGQEGRASADGDGIEVADTDEPVELGLGMDEADVGDGEQTSVEAQGDTADVASEAQAALAPSVSYRVHVQTTGDQASVKDGEVAGTSGQAKRLEAIWITLDKESSARGGVEYRTHVQTYGWQGWVANGAMSGTSGQAKRLEAIQIRLTGKLAAEYDVWYRVHAQRVGWMAWTKDGEVAGTAGLAWRLEAVQVLLLPKGATAPADVAGVQSEAELAYLEAPALTYRTHVQTYGWQGWVSGGQTAGTFGKAKRLEALEAKVSSGPLRGGLRYRTHVQTYGWQDWAAGGALSGTEGQAKRLEAVCVELTGELSQYFDVWYRTHIQTYGWLGWARNGESSGSEGLAKRMEAIEIMILPKGSAAPGPTEGAFRTFTSGDAELDAILETIINTKTGRGPDALRKALNYVKAFPYTYDDARYSTGSWRTWSVPLAKQMYRNGSGNCYRYASLITWIARALGYDARTVAGQVQETSTTWGAHAWCEISQDGKTYVVDPERQRFFDRNYPDKHLNFFMVTYDTAPVYYRY